MKTDTRKMEETKTTGQGRMFRFEYKPELIPLEGCGVFRYVPGFKFKEGNAVFMSGLPAMFKFQYDHKIVSENEVRNEGKVVGSDDYFQYYEPAVGGIAIRHPGGVVSCEKKYSIYENDKILAVIVNDIGRRLGEIGYSTSVEKTEEGRHISGRRILEKGGVMESVLDTSMDLIPKTDGLVARIHIERATYYDNSHIEGHGVSKKIYPLPIETLNKVVGAVDEVLTLVEYRTKKQQTEEQKGGCN